MLVAKGKANAAQKTCALDRDDDFLNLMKAIGSNEMPARKVLWIAATLAIVVGLAFVPLRSRECPSWGVWVTDQSGRPAPGVTVRLTYQNYSAERESHEIDAITDAQGHARFDSRILSISLGRRIAMMLWSATAGVHSSFGPHASISAFGDGASGFAIDEQRNVVVDWTGKSDHMESRIILTHLP